MNKLLIVLLVAVMFISGCATKTEYGECIGFWDKEKEHLEYKLSKRNVVLGLIFSETFLVPVVVAGWEIKCPEGTK